LRTRAIPERVRGVITTKRYTNPRYLYLYLARAVTIVTAATRHLCIHIPCKQLRHVTYAYTYLAYIKGACALDQFYLASALTIHCHTGLSAFMVIPDSTEYRVVGQLRTMIAFSTSAHMFLHPVLIRLDMEQLH